MTYREALDDQKRIVKFRMRHYYGTSQDETENNSEPAFSETYGGSCPPDIEMRTVNFYQT